MFSSALAAAVLCGLLLIPNGPAKAQGMVEYALILVYIDKQPVEVKGANGNTLGMGTAQAAVAGGSDGRTNGTIALEMPNLNLSFFIRFTDGAPPQILLDEHGDPNAAILVGHGEAISGGRTQYEAATVTFTKIPGSLKWTEVTLKRGATETYRLSAESDVTVAGTSFAAPYISSLP